MLCIQNENSTNARIGAPKEHTRKYFCHNKAEEMISNHSTISPVNYSNRYFLGFLFLLTALIQNFVPPEISFVKRQHLMAMVQLIWCGMVLGISFLESWIKFRAQFSVRYITLDIGRTVFFSLNRVELVLSSILYILGRMGKMMLLDWVPISFLLVQVLVLQPLLDSSAIVVITEATQKKKNHLAIRSPLVHMAYVLLEVIKVIVLFYASYIKL